MNGKRPIDIQREAALTINVSGDDKSSIREVFSTSSTLYTIKNHSVFKIQLADDIDPERTNLNIPNMTQQVLLAGYENEVVARVLLMTKYLFDTNNATVAPLIANLFEQSLELTKHILELQDMANQTCFEIDTKIESYLKTEQKSNAFSIPSILDLETKIHNIYLLKPIRRKTTY